MYHSYSVISVSTEPHKSFGDVAASGVHMKLAAEPDNEAVKVLLAHATNIVNFVTFALGVR